MNRKVVMRCTIIAWTVTADLSYTTVRKETRSCINTTPYTHSPKILWPKVLYENFLENLECNHEYFLCYLIVDGGWSLFGEWGSCSLTCGGGVQDRQRTCTNPSPAFGGRPCDGSSMETRFCQQFPCPGNLKEAIQLHLTTLFNCEKEKTKVRFVF